MPAPSATFSRSGEAFAYAPVSPVQVFLRRAEAGPRRFLSRWTLLLGPLVATGLITLGLPELAVEVGRGAFPLTFFLPFALATALALWFGFWWGAVPLAAARLVLAVAAGLPPGPALLLALADPVGLGVLVLAFQAAPVATTLRSPAALGFFVIVSFTAVLTASAGAFAWAGASQLGPYETLDFWQGWWLGSFTLHLLVTAPLLMLAGPRVEQWKRDIELGAHRPEQLSPGRLAFAFAIAVGALAGYVLLVRYFGWESLTPVDGLAPEVGAALEGLSLLQWITFLFIGLAGYFGYLVARGWNATAETLAETNARLKEALAERELAQARLVEFAVEQEQTSKAKDTFFSMISHDLRGPMGALLGLAEVTETRLDRHKDAELVEMAALMHRSAEHLYTLLINLLEWARLQTGQMRLSPEWVDLEELATATVEVLAAPAAEKGVWLTNRIAPGTVAWADATMVRSVLLNLVGNALKFTPSGGGVTLRATRTAEGRLAVTVQDTGVGMAEEDLARLFRVEKARSRTGTAGERGSGLGLLLCKEMVERHDGEITVASEPNAGSTFCFTLPLTPDGGEQSIHTGVTAVPAEAN